MIFPSKELVENLRKHYLVGCRVELVRMYTKTVNIDVLLKGHSGDSIRVDRIGRNSESIMNPSLSVLLAVQPNVLSGMPSIRTKQLSNLRPLKRYRLK